MLVLVAAATVNVLFSQTFPCDLLHSSWESEVCMGRGVRIGVVVVVGVAGISGWHDALITPHEKSSALVLV